MLRHYEPWPTVAATYDAEVVHVVGLASSECTAFVEAVSAHATPRWIFHDTAADLTELWAQFQTTHVAHPPAERRALFESIIARAHVIHLKASYLTGLSAAEHVFAPQSWDQYPQNAPLADWSAAHPGRLLSLIDIYMRVLPCTVVAVTGTNGKTTVTSLLVTLLEAAGREVAVGGNHRYHTQLLPRITAVTPDAIAVLEISHKHLSRLERGPDVGIVTNVAGDHLDELDWARYVARKRRLVELLEPSGLAILGADDPTTAAFCAATCARVALVSTRDQPTTAIAGWLEPEAFVWRDEQLLEQRIPRAASSLVGRHNDANILAALVATGMLGATPSAQEQGLRAFRGVKHRLELLRTIGGVRIYDDTAATSPAAAQAAVEALGEAGLQPVIVVGGRDKLNDYHALSLSIQRWARGVVSLEGSASDCLEAALNGAVPTVRAANLTDAIGKALAMAAGSGAVVVSPAGAGGGGSGARGEGLRSLVREWGRPALAREP